MKNVRVWYKKDLTAKYISHLDLVRCMGRAIKKAQIPIWYTQGFNPHPFMTFSLPLSLGIIGCRESMDIKIIDDGITLKEIKDRLNSSLPNGLEVIDVTLEGMKAKRISYALYEIILNSDNINKDELSRAIIELLKQDEIIIEKKTKSGVKSIDIKEYLENYDLKVLDTSVNINIILPAGSTKNINPNLILTALEKYKNIKPNFKIKRIDIYNELKEQFI